QQYLRMVFNIVARNQDDHTKNIAFIMDTNGKWRLAPAFDVTYAFNPAGLWTRQHQMSVNGKLDDFDRSDLFAVAREMNIKNADFLIQKVLDVVSGWPEYAKQAGVDHNQIQNIGRVHRIGI
ncbi:HipA domain-containing protein, partial [candidate division KSB1 bacterium]|nr:HipA domain-containing protein [candidate division KSB1 bacterium]